MLGREVSASVLSREQLGSGLRPKSQRAQWKTFLKRSLDILGSSFLLLIFFPCLLLLALLVKLHDGGPAIYHRRVIGPAGEFNAFKLRTMCVNAEEILRSNPAMRREYEKNFKLKNDPRITPLGAILRRLSLDELPQLLNVLRGEMSLVGPRMIAPDEREKHEAANQIFQVMKPGLTGYWQICGRQKVSYAERVQMDQFYVEHWSLLLDFQILLKTPIRVFRGEGAH
jgi:lipopolysaccharide/colanic/teichoic acid biosynthesis glycosyltransferase